MSRDMKPRNTNRSNNSSPKSKARGGTLLGMFLGLVIGIAIAAGVVWYMNKTPIPFVSGKNPPVTNGAAKPGTALASGVPGQATAPMALPGKPGDPIPEKRFQFYDILPGKADAVPDPKPAADAKKDGKTEEKKEEKKEELKQAIFLQAGSFSSAQDADNQKAKLALIGLEADVQQVMVQDKTYFRVRLGPYTKMDEASKVRSELAKASIDATLVKKEQQ